MKQLSPAIPGWSPMNQSQARGDGGAVALSHDWYSFKQRAAGQPGPSHPPAWWASCGLSWTHTSQPGWWTMLFTTLVKWMNNNYNHCLVQVLPFNGVQRWPLPYEVNFLYQTSIIASLQRILRSINNASFMQRCAKFGHQDSGWVCKALDVNSVYVQQCW